MVATIASKHLTPEQWAIYLENQKLVSWAVNRYSRNCSTTTQDEIRCIIEDTLMDAIRGYIKEKGKFGFFFNLCVKNAMGKYFHSFKRREDAITEIGRRISDSYLDNEPNEVAEQEDKEQLISRVLLAIAEASEGLSTNRQQLAVRYFQGELTFAEIAEMENISRQGAQKFVAKLKEKVTQKVSGIDY